MSLEAQNTVAYKISGYPHLHPSVLLSQFSQQVMCKATFSFTGFQGNTI